MKKDICDICGQEIKLKFTHQDNVVCERCALKEFKSISKLYAK